MKETISTSSSSIFFIANELNNGGAGKILSFVANQSLSHFASVYIYCFNDNGPNISIDSSIKIVKDKGHTPESVFERLIYMTRLRKVIKEISPSLICSFTSEISVMARFATLGMPIKFISAERADPYTLSLKWKWLSYLAYKMSDSCIFQLERAREFYGNKSSFINKSYVIPNPFILKIEVPPYSGERKKTIVSAGRFVPEKNFSMLIEACSIVFKAHPEFSLIIYGKGPLLDDYKKQVISLGVQDKVSFPGYNDNIASVIREDGIFVLPSKLEGIPNVLIEALSVGIPTVSTNCEPGGPAFLTENGKRGILVPIDDVKEMANAIIRIIEDNVLSNRLIQSGPDIRKILNASIIAQRWIDCFKLTLNR